jgi:hypothetical protein
LVLYRYINQPISSFLSGSTKTSGIRPQVCQHCSNTKFHGHGWRRRYVNHYGQDYHIFVQRFKCCGCRRTITILPSFLARKFIHSIDDILSHIKRSYQGLKDTISRQLSAFYQKRFRWFLSPLIMFLNGQGLQFSLPAKENEKAIKVIETLQSRLPNSLSESFFRSTNKHFMAH